MFKIASMKIQNSNDIFVAMNIIKTWLQAGEFNKDAFTEIEFIIEAVEDYMCTPLPAKNFIESKLRNN